MHGDLLGRFQEQIKARVGETDLWEPLGPVVTACDSNFDIFLLKLEDGAAFSGLTEAAGWLKVAHHRCHNEDQHSAVGASRCR